MIKKAPLTQGFEGVRLFGRGVADGHILSAKKAEHKAPRILEDNVSYSARRTEERANGNADLWTVGIGLWAYLTNAWEMSRRYTSAPVMTQPTTTVRKIAPFKQTIMHTRLQPRRAI